MSSKHPATKAPQFVSLRAYAALRKKRGLSGGTHGAVRKAIASNRLVRSVRANTKGQPLIEVELADLEWDQKTDPTQKRDPQPNASAKRGPKQPSLFGGDDTPRAGDGPAADEVVKRIRQSQSDKLKFAALIAELDYRNRARELCEVAIVEREVTRLVTAVLKDLYAIPDRHCAHLAALTDPHRVKMTLTNAIEQACRELAEHRLKLFPEA